MNNPTSKQHFVPRFYLKNFANPEGNFHFLNVKERRVSTKPRSYRGFGYEFFYYALITGIQDDIAQIMEEWFGQIENYVSEKLPAIIKRIETYQQISDDDRYVLSVLMSMLWLRTPGMRSQLRAMHEDSIKKIEKLLGKDTGNELIEKDNRNHLIFILNSLGFKEAGFANMFFSMKWKAYIASGEERFVTSDSPVVEKWLPPKSFYGASFLERNKYFPLTPKILFELTFPCGATKIKRKTLYKEDDEIVRSLNIITTAGAQNFVYLGDKEPLEKLLAGIRNPGRLEIEYIRKYEIPWIEYRKRMDE